MVVAEYFGPRWHAPALTGAVGVPTPVGRSCLWCGVPVAVGDRGWMRPLVQADGTVAVGPSHAECELLSVAGHLVGVCPCTGWGSGRAAALEAWRRLRGGGPASAAESTSDPRIAPQSPRDTQGVTATPDDRVSPGSVALAAHSGPTSQETTIDTTVHDPNTTALAALGLTGDPRELVAALGMALRGWPAALTEWMGDLGGDDLHRVMRAASAVSAAAEAAVLARRQDAGHQPERYTGPCGHDGCNYRTGHDGRHSWQENPGRG